MLVVSEKPHDRFTRRGNDLVSMALEQPLPGVRHSQPLPGCRLPTQDTTVTLSLVQALEGGSTEVAGLDGRAISVPLGRGPVQPGSRVTLPGAGMPISKTGGRGDLRVTLKVQLPQLSAEQQAAVRKACYQAQ